VQLEEIENLETEKIVMKTAKKDCGGCSNSESGLKAEALEAPLTENQTAPQRILELEQ
jgi:hypothetical protein